MTSSSEKHNLERSRKSSYLRRSNRIILLALVVFAAFFYALTVVRIGALPEPEQKGLAPAQTEQQEAS